jgi:hypothetical protein
MKNPINPLSFILGAAIGGLAVFTIAAEKQRPATWDYKVVRDDLKYNVPDFYSELVNQNATNGWEVVSSQLFPNRPEGNALDGARVYIVLKHSKH